MENHREAGERPAAPAGPGPAGEKAWYGPEDVPPEARDAAPGRFPFRRGIYPEMYRRRPWTIRQYSGFGGPAETNARFRKILAEGGTGLSLAFDLPTQLGLDSDHLLARGEVGRAGVAMSTVDDMAGVFEGVDQGAVSVSMTINAPAAVVLAFYLLAARRRGVPWKLLRGTVQNDILKEYIARGAYIFPPEPSLRLVADIFAFCRAEVPLFNAISVSGYHIREAGATAAQEVAFTLANGREYVRRFVAAGQEIGAVGRQTSFFFAVQNGFLEEAAKFRAARVLWAEIMKEEFGADDEACRLRFHAQTAGSTLTAQQPLNNVVRVAAQALSAVLGGAQSIHTNAWDEALALPSEDSLCLALRTQQIIACETNAPSVADPLGGSYYVERLTERHIEEARGIFKRIEEQGGMLEAVRSGAVKRWIQESAYRHQQAVESGGAKIVGVNCHREEGDAPRPAFRADPALEEDAAARLRGHRGRRDAGAAEKALAAVAAAARGADNLMPPIIAAADAGATLGEICDALKAVFGEHRPGGEF